MNEKLRVAFFPDSYLEVNGAAMTCKRLTDYARRNDFPFLCIYAGPKNGITMDGSVTNLALKRSPLAISMDEDLAYDGLFYRHYWRVLEQIKKFKPDVLHITGVNDVSNIGAIIAYRLQLPLLASWHTNVHEFAASRLERMFRFLPGSSGKSIGHVAENLIMKGSLLYYRMPKVVLSPNQELVEELGKGTGRTSRLMGRGVDTEKFGPDKRTVNDDTLRFGFVGRLRAEKNVRVLVEIEKALIAAGKTNFKFLIVGEGTERDYLESEMQNAEFTGFLEGEALSEAYANMDVFLFPSETDAFGNVTQEATASGVPAIVSDKGGPKFLIEAGETGYVASNVDDFVKYASELFDDRDKLARMKVNARKSAMSRSWDSIFDGVYDAYRECICLEAEAKTKKNG